MTFLREFGLDVSLWQIIIAGVGAYVVLLDKHEVLNRWHSGRQSAAVARYHRLTRVYQGMIVAGMAQGAEYERVMSERTRLEDRLGHLLEPEVFYHKLGVLTRCLRFGIRVLKALAGWIK